MTGRYRYLYLDITIPSELLINILTYYDKKIQGVTRYGASLVERNIYSKIYSNNVAASLWLVADHSMTIILLEIFKSRGGGSFFPSLIILTYTKLSHFSFNSRRYGDGEYGWNP